MKNTKLKNSSLNNDKVLKLTARQKIITLVSSIVIFITSFILFFPLDEIVRYQLNKAGKAGGFSVNFDSFSLGLIGSTNIKNLHYISKSGTNIKVENVILDVSLTDLLSSEIDGDISLSNAYIYLAKGSVHFNLNGTILLKKIKKKSVRKMKSQLKLYNGFIKLHIKQITLPPFENIPMLGESKKIFIKSIDIDGKVRKNKFTAKKAILIESDILSATAEGYVQYSPGFMNSRLNMAICLKLKPKIFVDYPMAETIKTMIPDYEDKLCHLNVSGRFNSLKSNINSLLKLKMPTADNLSK